MRPIVVLGPERSGTSLVAEMIDRWGAYVGDRDQLSGGDRNNPRGYWEFRPLWDLAEEIGEFASGVSWWDESFPDLVASKVRDRTLAAAARGLIVEMERAGRPWMWKDPALCHLLPFWTEFWRDPVFVLTVRHPIAIACSWHEFAIGSPRRPTSTDCNLLRWQYMALAALAAAESADAVLFVEYERLVGDTHLQARRLASALDDACESATSDETIAAMAAVPDTALCHHRPTSGEGLDAVQRALYDLQRAKVDRPDTPFDINDFPLPRGWRDRILGEERAAMANQAGPSTADS